MVGSLGPVVHGAGRQFRRIAVLHTLGLMCGALLMCGGLVLLGEGIRELASKPLEFAVVAVPLALSGAQTVLGMRPFQSQWQVPENWRRLLDFDMLALAYGFLLGLGLFTAVVVSAFWVFVALTLLVAPQLALVGWVVYAAVRGAGLWFLGRRAMGNWRFLTPGGRRMLVTGATAMSVLAVGAHVPL